MAKDKTLPTEDLLGVELVAVGTHDASTGRVRLTKRDLQDIVAAYEKTKGVLRVPAKLGHGEDDNLLEPGMPAVGWVENVRLSGSKLVADIMRVPKKLADLIRAGAWRTRSVEIRHDYSITGKGVFRRILTGLAWLGAELPAVKGLEDVFNLYAGDKGAALAFSGDDDGGVTHVFTECTPQQFEAAMAAFDSLTERIAPLVAGQRGVREARAIMAAARRQIESLLKKGAKLASVPAHDPPVLDDDTWEASAALDELRAWASTDGSGDPDTIDFDKYAEGFAVIDGPPDNVESYKFPHHRVVDGELMTSRAGVVAAWNAAQGAREGEPNTDAQKHLEPHREALGLDEPEDDEGDSDMETAKLAEALGLDKDAKEADVLAAITKLKAGEPKPKDADPGTIEAQVTKLSTENATLRDRVLKMEAEDLKRQKLGIFERACKDGRYVPAQRDDFLALAAGFSDADGLKTLTEIVSRQPVTVEYGERGRRGGEASDLSEFEPSAAEKDAIRSSYPADEADDIIERATRLNAQRAGVRVPTKKATEKKES